MTTTKRLPPDSGPGQAEPGRETVAGSLLLLLGSWVWLFRDYLPRLAEYWSSLEAGSRSCLLILAICILARNIRRRSTPIAGGMPWPGLLLIAAAAAGVCFGLAAGQDLFLFLGMWLSLCGLVIIPLGTQSLRYFGLPLFVLLFSIPPTQLVNEQLTAAMQTLYTTFSDLLGLAGESKAAAADLQSLPALKGIRFYIPGLLVGISAGYILRLGSWKLTGLVFLSLPVSVAAGSVQLISLSLMGKDLGSAGGGDWAAVLTGSTVMLLSMAVLAWGMAKAPAVRIGARAGWSSPTSRDVRPPSRLSIWVSTVSAVLLFALTSLLLPG